MLLHSATSAVSVQVKATKQLGCGCHTGQGHDCSKVKHHSVLCITVSPLENSKHVNGSKYAGKFMQPCMHYVTHFVSGVVHNILCPKLALS